MILVMAGTRDGRQIAEDLVSAGYPVIISVVSDYGKELAETSVPSVNVGKLTSDAMIQLIKENSIKCIIDASHPYASAASQTALTASAATRALYLRYERPKTPLPTYHKLQVVDSYEQAAQLAALLGSVVFITTGSRNLAVFSKEPALHNHRLIARVLPDPQVILECLGLGLSLKNIIALQGPFTHELNVALFRAYNADVIITKNSGETGGTDTKISAAMELDLSLVVIDRPSITYPNLVSSRPAVLDFIRGHLS